MRNCTPNFRTLWYTGETYVRAIFGRWTWTLVRLSLTHMPSKLLPLIAINPRDNLLGPVGPREYLSRLPCMQLRLP
jgi:hypothetical protein